MTAPIPPPRPARARQARALATARRWLGVWPEATLALVALAGLVLAYRGGSATVSIHADGVDRVLRTRAPTVGDVLLEAGVPLGADDLVVPGPSHHLAGGDRIEVRRARDVVVNVDGEARHLRTQGQTAEDVLSQAGVTLAPGDRVYVNGAPWPAEPPHEHAAPPDTRIAGLVIGASRHGAPLADEGTSGDPETTAEPAPADTWDVSVYRPVEVDVDDDGFTHRVALAGPTIADALVAAGVPLWDADGVMPPRDTPPEAGMRIEIRRATPFVVDLDGRRATERALATTVGEGLELAGMGLRGRDYSVPDASAPLVAGGEVKVVRVKEDILVEEVAVPFTTDLVADANMNLDDKRVDREGVPGSKTVRTRIVYENGEEVDRTVLEETVNLEPVSQIVSYGTNILWGTIDTPEGPQRYWRRLHVYATSYSAARSGTPKSAPWYGHTRSGLPMRKGIVAVDPRIIPLFTKLYVEGYGVGVAGDTGGGVRNYFVDLGYDDDNYESWHWPVDVYLLEPLPPDRDMRWVLP